MGKVWLLVALILYTGFHSSTGVTSNLSARPSIINVGAILSFNSTIGKVAKVAIEAAVDDINSNSSVLNGTKLQILLQDTKISSGFLGIVDFLLLMENETVAVIGPQYSVVAHAVLHIANELQVPLLSFAATDPSLSSPEFPFFVRTTHNDQSQMAAVADVVNYYDWKDVIAIFADDDQGRNGIAALGDMLTEKQIKISYRAPIRINTTREEISDVLVKVALMESRVIVLHIYPDIGLELLHVAQDLDMMINGYVWIATDWLSTKLDTDPSQVVLSMNDIQGVLTLRKYTPDSAMKRDFVSRWSKLTREKSPDQSPFGLTAYGLIAYDTVWVLATAIDRFLSNGGSFTFANDSTLINLRGNSMHLESIRVSTNGGKLLENILEVNTTGLIGNLVFASDGNLMHPAYEIINVIGTGTNRIGYWSNASLSVIPPDKVNTGKPSRSNCSGLTGVIWPGQATQTPRGWVFANNGRPLRIAVPLRVSHPEFASRTEGTDMFSGYCIDVFTAAVDLLPYAVPYKFIAFGDGKTNPSYAELIHKITTGEFDAAVGDIAITTDRTKLVDFTQPYIESGLVVVAPIKQLKSSPWAFLRPFSPRMWFVTGMFFFVVGAVVWILERPTNEEFRGPPRRQLATIIWFSFSTLFFAHKEKTVSTLGRLVLLLWLFVVLIINSSYTASLTSILTVEQLSSSVKGIDSLVASNYRVGYLKGSFAGNYLTQELNIKKSRLIPLNSPAEYEKALKDGDSNGGVAAIIDERAHMELFLSSRCEFGLVGQEFTKMGWGFAFPRESPLAVDMSTAILKLSEHGNYLQRIHDKWLSRSACISDGAKQDVEKLDLKSFWGLFLLSGAACFIALVCYACRMAYRFLRHSDPNINQGSSLSVRLQSFIWSVNEGKNDESNNIRVANEGGGSNVDSHRHIGNEA